MPTLPSVDVKIPARGWKKLNVQLETLSVKDELALLKQGNFKIRPSLKVLRENLKHKDVKVRKAAYLALTTRRELNLR